MDDPTILSRTHIQDNEINSKILSRPRTWERSIKGQGEKSVQTQDKSNHDPTNPAERNQPKIVHKHIKISTINDYDDSIDRRDKSRTTRIKDMKNITSFSFSSSQHSNKSGEISKIRRRRSSPMVAGALSVTCEGGFDGGLDQIFWMQAYQNGRLEVNSSK